MLGDILCQQYSKTGLDSGSNILPLILVLNRLKPTENIARNDKFRGKPKGERLLPSESNMTI